MGRSIISEEEGDHVADVFDTAYDERSANAALIVTAVNAHDDLVRELRSREWCDDGDKFGPHCQTCGNWKSSGHSPGCKLKVVLDLCEAQE